MVQKPKQLSRKSKKSSKSRKSQRGGVSSLDYESSAKTFTGNSASNVHNTNPQASLDLDNKYMAYGGPVPLGSSFVGGTRKAIMKHGKNNKQNNYKGGSSCGSEGVGTGKPKSETFKQYLTNLDANLSAVTGGNPNPKPNSKPNSIPNKTGGGYTSDPSEFIGGRPVYKGYDDNSPPAIIDGKLMFGSPDQSVCGNGAISGGFRRLHKGSKKHMKSKRKSKSKSKGKKGKKGSRKSQQGGDFTTLHSSKPVEYASAFNGPVGVFKYPDDMTARTFDGKQPIWGVTDI